MARRLRQDRSGIAAVEFALVAPMLILLLLGVLEFGRLMWVNSNLQFAAEQATRYAIAHTSASPDDITAQAQSALQGMGVTWSPACGRFRRCRPGPRPTRPAAGAPSCTAPGPYRSA